VTAGDGGLVGSAAVAASRPGSAFGSDGEDCATVSASAFSNDEGLVRLRLPAGSYRFVAEKGLRVGATSADLFPGAVERIEVRMEDCMSVQGRVLGAWDLLPIAGAEVWLQKLGRARSVLTDATGSFTMATVPANGRAQAVHFAKPDHGIESAWVIARPDGTWATRLAGVATGDSPAAVAPGPGPVQETEGGSKRGGPPSLVALVREGPVPPAVMPDVLLVPARSIHGHVLTEEGAPVEGARIQAVGHYLVRPGMSFPDRAAARSGADGTFSVTGLRSDIGHTLRCFAPGRAVEDVFVPASADPAYDCGPIRLRAEIVVCGRAVDARGLPVEGVLVKAAESGELEHEEPDSDLFPRDAGHALPLTEAAHTDVRGRFRFAGLRAGRWQLVLVAGGRAWVRREILLTSGPELEIELRLPDEAPALEGMVMRDGRPVAGAQVCLRLGSRRRVVTSDDDGRFRAAGVESDEPQRLSAVLVEPEGDGYVSDAVTAPPGQLVVLELHAPPSGTHR
jgi:hypothetical protein